MSHVTPRWALGTARLRAGEVLRRTRGWTARAPIADPVLPKPALARGRRPLWLAQVLVASDLNTHYLGCWPLARRAWRAITGLEPLLVLVAEEAPEELRADPLVRVFEPVAGLHTAFQAQCIRLLYPALLDTDGAVLTADVDMVPLDRRYFRRPAGQVDERHFLCYRDVLLPIGQLPICYNAARPETWRELFDVDGPEAVRTRLAEWGAGLAYDGVRGGAGWDTDQLTLYRTLLEWGRRTRRAWVLDDRYTGFRRLERSPLLKHGLTAAEERRIRRRGYSDFHLLHPFPQHAELNERVVELAGG